MVDNHQINASVTAVGNLGLFGLDLVQIDNTLTLIIQILSISYLLASLVLKGTGNSTPLEIIKKQLKKGGENGSK